MAKPDISTNFTALIVLACLVLVGVTGNQNRNVGQSGNTGQSGNAGQSGNTGQSGNAGSRVQRRINIKGTRLNVYQTNLYRMQGRIGNLFRSIVDATNQSAARTAVDTASKDLCDGQRQDSLSTGMKKSFAEFVRKILLKFNSKAYSTQDISLMRCLALSWSERDYGKLRDLSIIDAILEQTRNYPKMPLSKAMVSNIISSRMRARRAHKWNADDAQKLQGVLPYFFEDQKIRSIRQSSFFEANVTQKAMRSFKWKCGKIYFVSVAFKSVVGGLDLITAEMIEKYGGFLCSFQCNIFNSMKFNFTENDYATIAKLGQINWANCQARAILKYVLSLSRYTNIESWNDTTYQELGNILSGLNARQCGRMNLTRSSLKYLQTLEVAPAVQPCLFKAVKDVSKNPRSWGKDVLKVVFKVPKSLKASDVREMNKTLIFQERKLIKNSMKQMNKVVRKILAKEIVEGFIKEGKGSITAISKTFLSQLSARHLHGLDVKKLGFGASEQEATNGTNGESSTDDTDRLDPAISRAVFVNIKSSYGAVRANSSFWTENKVKQIGFFLGGASVKDIKNFNCNVTRVVASQFDKIAEDITFKQAKEVVRKAMSCVVDKTDTKDIDEALVDELGKNMVFADLDKVVKNTSAINRACRYIGKHRRLHKVPVADLRKIAGKCLKLFGKSNPTDVVQQDIEDLGGLFPYVNASFIKGINSLFINAESSGIDCTKNPKGEFCQAVALKIKEHYQDGGSLATVTTKFNTSILVSLVKMLPAFSNDDIKNIPTSSLQAVLEDVATLPSIPNARDLLSRLFNSSAASASKRKRRSTPSIDLSTKTAAEITSMGTLLYGLTPEEILTITDAVFKETLATIGALSGFNSYQTSSWVTVLKRAFGASLNLGSTELKQLGYIALGLSAGDFGLLDMNTTDVISALGVLSNYTAAQKSAAYGRVKQLLQKTLPGFSDSEVIALGYFIQGASASELLTMSNSTFSSSYSSLGKLNGWHADSLKSLKQLAVAAFGIVGTWATWEIRNLGATIGGLSGSEVQIISPDAFAFVTPDAIKQMPPSLVAELTTSQLSSVGPEQAAAFTVEQKSALSPEKLSALENAGNEQAAPTTTLSPTKIWDPNNDASVSLGSVTLIAVSFILSAAANL